jgi:hypothetical protein
MKRALATAFTLFLLAPATALADGLPVTGIYGSSGVTTRDGAYRYVTFPSSAGTVVARVRTADGTVARYRAIAGRFTVPSVAYDGSTTGLSTDDRTLVLLRPRRALGEKHTRIAVLDARRLLVQKRITLPGDFSIDAVSPDGATAFAIEYRALGRKNFDPSDYRVRALDTATGRLEPKPIVDPREPDEQMGGLPVARVMSPDTRWAYTLYSGSEHPFIHALDTTGRSARCVDLDALLGRDDIFQLRLRVAAGGRRIEVAKGDTPVQVVDARTFVVSDPPPASKPAARPVRTHDGGGTPLWPWALALGLLALLAAAGARPLARAARAR